MNLPERLDGLFEARKKSILNFESDVKAEKSTYYVSADGDDENDGLSPDTAWKTLKRVSGAELSRGDAVLFRRGDLFRGSVVARSGVTYSAYGQGEKPRLYGSELSLASPELWRLFDAEHNIWVCTQRVLDSGTLVFNEGEAHAIKLIPSYIGGGFVCREDESRPFDLKTEMKNDLELYWHFDGAMTERPSRGQSFPVPDPRGARGELYLRCDRGNPGEVFWSVESLSRVHLFAVGASDHVTIDNLCIKYVGMHGVSASGQVVGLKVRNCELAWIGGTIQHYYGTDPNYPEGGRGTVTRFGNAVEIYGGCEDYEVSNNYIHQVYDAGVTHQVSTDKRVTMRGISYTDNLIERCVYGIEYFLDQLNGENESFMERIVIEGNFIRLSGYGWGQQRHNKSTPAHIKGWSYKNTARDFYIRNNVFDRSAYRMLHLVAARKESCPTLEGNIYIQDPGGMLGQYGGNEVSEPELLRFDRDVEVTIKQSFGDESAKIYFA